MSRDRIERGDIWIVDLGLAQKVRPVLVLSIAYLDNERAVVSYVPRTTSIRNTRFEVTHRAVGFQEGVFDAQGIGTVPTVKLARYLGKVNADVLAKVEDAIRNWLLL